MTYVNNGRRYSLLSFPHVPEGVHMDIFTFLIYACNLQQMELW